MQGPCSAQPHPRCKVQGLQTPPRAPPHRAGSRAGARESPAGKGLSPGTPGGTGPAGKGLTHGDILPPPSALALATQGCPAEALSPGPPARPPREGFSPLPAGARGCRWDRAPCPGYTAPGPRWVLWVGDTGAAESIGWQPPPRADTEGHRHCAGTDGHALPAQPATVGQHRWAQGPAAVGAHRSVALRGWGPHPMSPRRTMDGALPSCRASPTGFSGCAWRGEAISLLQPALESQSPAAPSLSGSRHGVRAGKLAGGAMRGCLSVQEGLGLFPQTASP